MTHLYFAVLLFLSVSTQADIHNTRFGHTLSISQTMPSQKDQYIEQAHKIFASKYPEFVFDPLLYDITVWKNSKETIVRYRRIIRFTPLNKKDSNLSFDFEVNLSNQDISPFDYWGFDNFYIPTAEEQEHLDFVIRSFGLPRSGFNNSIVETSDMYVIYLDNEMVFGQYYIDKITGNQSMGAVEGNYEPMPDFPELTPTDPLIEITD
ncbi:hypothetical protein [Formosa algae]|uniref:hypothetical protein n=1 Tax=Formosa algae TaxID=225843 RepID=UPI0011AEC80E|nr:hypothetical protein [Formosa algae]